MPFIATWMDLEIIILNEVKSDKDKYMILLMCGTLENDISKLIYKTEIDSQTQKTNLWLPMGKCGGGGITKEIGINIYNF